MDIGYSSVPERRPPADGQPRLPLQPRIQALLETPRLHLVLFNPQDWPPGLLREATATEAWWCRGSAADEELPFMLLIWMQIIQHSLEPPGKMLAITKRKTIKDSKLLSLI